jgi:hypothetical protein
MATLASVRSPAVVSGSSNCICAQQFGRHKKGVREDSGLCLAFGVVVLIQQPECAANVVVLFALGKGQQATEICYIVSIIRTVLDVP